MLAPFSHGEYREGKTNDCVVRALSNVTLQEYEDCEELLHFLGRNPNKGATLKQITESCFALGLKNVESFGKRNQNRMLFHGGVATKQQKGIALKRFIKNHPKDNFVVVYSKHVVAVIGGKIVDTTENNPNVRIIAAFSLRR